MVCTGTNLVDAEETTASIVEDAPALLRLSEESAGAPALTAALQERGVQVTLLHHLDDF